MNFPLWVGAAVRLPPTSAAIWRHSAMRCRCIPQGIHSLPAREVRDGYTIIRSFALRRRLHTCTVPEMAAYLALTLVPTLKHVYAWKPDVIHVHFAVPTGVIAWLIHQLTGIPYVLSVYLGDVPGGVPEQTDHLFKWIKPLTIPIWKAAAAVIAPATHIRHLARQHYDVSTEIIPNGIDLAGAVTSPAAPANPVRLVFAGRLSIQKNPLFLLESLSQVKHLPWRLDILGDGPLRVAAQNLAMELGLDFQGLFPRLGDVGAGADRHGKQRYSRAALSVRRTPGGGDAGFGSRPGHPGKRCRRYQ